MNTSAIASDAQGAGHPAPAGIDAPWTAPTVTRRQVSYATWVCFFAWVFAVYDFILFGTPVSYTHLTLPTIYSV